MKKIVIFLGILLIIFLSINLYIRNNQTVECWWGVLYPTLSFIALEDEEAPKYSSLNNHFIEQEPEIKYDFMFLKWFKEKFSY